MAHLEIVLGIGPSNRFPANERYRSDKQFSNMLSGRGPDSELWDKSRNCREEMAEIEGGIWFKSAFLLKLSFSRLGMRASSGFMLPVRLLLERESTFKDCSFSSPLPIFPESRNPSSAISETRLFALHLMKSHKQGDSSSSFHDSRDLRGSLRPDLKTMRPKTSSFSGSVC